MILFSFMVLAIVKSIIMTGLVDEEKIEKHEVRPELFDVLLPDLPIEELKLKTKYVFGFEYNSKTTEIAAFPIKGVILKGTYERIVMPIIISHKKKKIQSVCVADTGAPYTYLSDETLRTLNLEIAEDNGFNLNVHGSPVTIWRSVNHFKDINLCGQSFFAENKLEFVINYRTRKAVARETEKLTQEELDEL